MDNDNIFFAVFVLVFIGAAVFMVRHEAHVREADKASRTAMCESMCATDKASCYKYFAEAK